MKRLATIFLIFTACGSFAQQNEFYFNGAADVIFRFPPRGDGGRAFVHYPGNILSLNYGEDFSGGTLIGQNTFFKDNGSSYIFGKFGIGTINPAGILDLKNSNNSNLIFDLSTNSLSKIISNGWNASIDFSTYQISGIQNVSQLFLHHTGFVGIGTATPKEKLSVNGKIRAHEIKVEATNWPDYVFEEGYQVEKLEALERYLKTHKHLPEMPSAKEVEENGIAVGELVKLQQKKIEELTLYLIEKDKLIRSLLERMTKVESQMHKK